MTSEEPSSMVYDLDLAGAIEDSAPVEVSQENRKHDFENAV